MAALKSNMNFGPVGKPFGFTLKKASKKVAETSKMSQAFWIGLMKALKKEVETLENIGI